MHNPKSLPFQAPNRLLSTTKQSHVLILCKRFQQCNSSPEPYIANHSLCHFSTFHFRRTTLWLTCIHFVFCWEFATFRRTYLKLQPVCPRTLGIPISAPCKKTPEPFGIPNRSWNQLNLTNQPTNTNVIINVHGQSLCVFVQDTVFRVNPYTSIPPKYKLSTNAFINKHIHLNAEMNTNNSNVCVSSHFCIIKAEYQHKQSNAPSQTPNTNTTPSRLPSLSLFPSVPRLFGVPSKSLFLLKNKPQKHLQTASHHHQQH